MSNVLCFLQAWHRTVYGKKDGQFLSWRRTLWSITWPWASTKHLPHTISSRASYTPPNSDSIEFPVLSFCTLDILMSTPASRAIIISMWPLHLYNVRHTRHLLIYHRMAERQSTVIHNFMCIVPFKYIRPCFSLSQSSSSGLLTHFVRKDTSVYISGHTHWPRREAGPL